MFLSRELDNCFLLLAAKCQDHVVIIIVRTQDRAEVANVKNIPVMMTKVSMHRSVPEMAMR